MSRSSSEGRRRTHFVGAILLTAVLASAATSSLFIALQSQARSDDPLGEVAATAKTELATLVPGLEAVAITHANELNETSQKPVPDVVVGCVLMTQSNAQPVTVVNRSEQSVAELLPSKWELLASSSHEQWQYRRVVDVRRSHSLTNPGYEGEVEFSVRVSQRLATQAGQYLPEPPEGYELATVALAQELSQNSDFGQTAALHPSVAEKQVYYEYPAWTPTEPPPADLPSVVQSQFHSTIFACLESKPTITTETRRRTFRFSLSDKSWAIVPE